MSGKQDRRTQSVDWLLLSFGNENVGSFADEIMTFSVFGRRTQQSPVVEISDANGADASAAVSVCVAVGVGVGGFYASPNE